MKYNYLALFTKVFYLALFVWAFWLVMRKLGFIKSENEVNETDLQKLFEKINPDNVGISEAEYSVMVSRLKLAFNGFGTDEATITEIMQKIRTKDEYMLLVVSFGYYDGKTLGVWLFNELDSAERGLFNQYFKDKNIDIKL